MELKTQLMWIIAGLGLVALVGVFKRMRGGFNSAENVRVLCATLSLIVAGLVAAVEMPYAFLGALFFGGVVGYVIGKTRAETSLVIDFEGAPPDDIKKRLSEALSK